MFKKQPGKLMSEDKGIFTKYSPASSEKLGGCLRTGFLEMTENELNFIRIIEKVLKGSGLMQNTNNAGCQ